MFAATMKRRVRARAASGEVLSLVLMILGIVVATLFALGGFFRLCIWTFDSVINLAGWLVHAPFTLLHLVLG